MTPEQKFLFDLNGFVLIENALTPEEIAAYREGIYRLCHEKAPDGADWNEQGEPRRTLRVTRPIERDPLFLNLVDHPSVLPILQTVLGESLILIDNDVELSPRHNNQNSWHRGCGTHGYHAADGKFQCTMVKCIWYLSDIRKGQNATRIIPGSHKSWIAAPPPDSNDHLPGEIELEVTAGTVLIFSEACLHAGNVNPSDITRVNMYFNYGPSWVQPWEGYRPSERLVREASGIRRQILGGGKIYSNTEEEALTLYA
jgi:ectoine hydroxylase-related dioxygenase (phytanoyl-CoA dioxygenase family)